MNILGIGGFELLVIAAVAFFVLGPRKMASTGKAMGKMIRELRRQRDELTTLIMQEPEFEDEEESAPPQPDGAVARSDAGDQPPTGNGDATPGPRPRAD